MDRLESSLSHHVMSGVRALTSGRSLGHEGKVLMDGIVVMSYRETRRIAFGHMRTNKKVAFHKPRGPSPANSDAQRPLIPHFKVRGKISVKPWKPARPWQFM